MEGFAPLGNAALRGAAVKLALATLNHVVDLVILFGARAIVKILQVEDGLNHRQFP